MHSTHSWPAPSWWVSRWFLILMLLQGACSSGRVKIDVRVLGLTPEMTTLQVSLLGGSLGETKTRKHSQGLDYFVVSFDAAAAGEGPLTLDVDALDERACGIAHGQDSAVPVRPGATVTVQLIRFATNRCQLRVRKLGTGGGRIYAAPSASLTEPGVDCDGVGPRCQVSHPPRQDLLLVAESSADSFFVGWSGSVSSCQGLDPCRVTTLDGELDIRATFLPRTACRPDGWCWEQPKPNGASIDSLYGVSPNQVWAVGNGGTILLWNGALWASYDSPTQENLHGIWGSGKDDIWAVGNGGTILHWDGLEWRVTPTSFVQALAAIHGSGSQRVVAVGTQGMYVEWDGLQWRDRKIDTEAQLLGVWVGEREAWAIADRGVSSVGPNDNFVHVTGDGVQILRDVTTGHLRKLFGIDSKHLWAITHDSLLSYDGATWRQRPGPVSPLQPAPVYSYLGAIWGTGEENLWVAGNLGPYFQVTPSGYRAASVTMGEVLALYGFGANDIFAAGVAGLLSRWNGTQWVPQSEQSYQFFQSIFALSPTKVFAASLDGLISEFDGNVWRPRFYFDSGISSLWGTGPEVLWAASLNGKTYRYDPVGDDWITVPTGLRGVLNSISGRSPTDIWAVGVTTNRTGVLLHWDGTKWGSIAMPSGFIPVVIWDTGGQDVWTAGLDGWIVRIDRSTNIAYHPVIPELTHDIETIWGSSPSDVWFAGSFENSSSKDSVIAHWDGTRLTIDRDSFLGSESIRKIWGTSERNIWASGANVLLHYDGKDWTRARGVQAPLLGFANLAPAGQPPDILAVGPHSIVMRRKGY